MVPRMVERRVGLEETVLPIGYHETGMTSRAPERKRLRKPLTCANTSGPRRARTDDLRIKSVTPMRFPHSTPQARDQPERPNPQQPQRYCRLARTNRHQPTTTPADNPPEPLRSPCRGAELAPVGAGCSPPAVNREIDVQSFVKRLMTR